MIRKDLNEITEADIGQLCEIRRSEDERIEFKQSFKGGSDLAGMSDSEREKAITGLAKEAVAFLNYRGGDIVIGIAEDDDGVASSLAPVDASADTAERLRRSLQARIEPRPRSMSIRSVVAEGDFAKGYIVIRCEASLQAPHRIIQSKEFYVRKGTEASPMDINEIHDLTLRTAGQGELIQKRVHEELGDVEKSIANNRNLSGPGFRIRLVYAPLSQAQLRLTDEILVEFRERNNSFYYGDKKTSNDVAFRNLSDNWLPVLRGKMIELWVPGGEHERAGYASKRIQSDGTIVYDWFTRYYPEKLNAPAVYFEWYQGFLAEICRELRMVEKTAQLGTNALIGLAMRAEPLHGNIPCLITGRGPFENFHPFPALERIHNLPIFRMGDKKDYSLLFNQAQKDLLNLCGLDHDVASLDS